MARPRPGHGHALAGAGGGLLLGLGQEGVVEKCFEINSVFGIALEEVHQQVGELRRGAGRDPRRQLRVLLVKLLQSLRRLGLREEQVPLDGDCCNLCFPL